MMILMGFRQPTRPRSVYNLRAIVQFADVAVCTRYWVSFNN